MKNFLKIMKALSDPSRVKIVKMLQHKAMCVCEIRAALDLAQPTVSKHLKIMEDAGLIRSRKEGLWVNYQLVEATDSPYAAALLAHLRTWLEKEPEIQEMVKKLPALRREDLCKK